MNTQDRSTPADRRALLADFLRGHLGDLGSWSDLMTSEVTGGWADERRTTYELTFTDGRQLYVVVEDPS